MCARNVYLVPALRMELSDVEDDFDSGAEDNVMQAIDIDNVHVQEFFFETRPVNWQQAHSFVNYWPEEEARGLGMASATEQWEQYDEDERSIVISHLWNGFHKWLMPRSALDETRFDEAEWPLEQMEVFFHCFDFTSECGRFRVLFEFQFDMTQTRVLRVRIAYRGPACLILRSNFSDSDERR